MLQKDRPNPDELLAQVKAEEQQRTRGKLKIFLGYVAGVGKTYAMLEAARQRQAEGIEVVVGYVETHGRAETEALLQGLEIIPRRQVAYRGVSLPEMDVDAVLARRPPLVVVDEFAHTNAPGSRHPKRYQDVEELLIAGIDVYTTLNIQHLESLNDVVAQITGVTVRETVPDRLLDEANEIVLIDLPTNELLQRLNEGKVYVPDQAARAMQKFFRPGNLAALREMALRRAAERVDDQMRAYMQTRAIPGPWPVAERLLVCVSPSPLSERVVRAGRRLADPLNAEWLAVYVETPGQASLPEADRSRVARTLQLAETLGAKSITLTGRDVVETLVSYARQHNVTKIIAGKPARPAWRDWLSRSLVDKLIQYSGDIDVYIITDTSKTVQPAEPFTFKPRSSWPGYVQSLGLVGLVTLIGELIHTYIVPTNLVMLFLLVVVIAAVRLGRGPAIVASISSVLVFDFLFVPPRLTFAVSDTQYLLTFAALFIVGFVISTLVSQTREQAVAALRREAQTTAVYALSRDLAGAVGLEAITQAVITHIGQTFDREVAIFLPVPDGQRLVVQAASADFGLDEDKYVVATWAFQHGQPAGRGTDTLVAADARYLPLKTARGVVGVLSIKLSKTGQASTPEQRRLMDTFASQTALAIERAQLAEQARQAQLVRETEKLQAALFDSLSHDLRTPLASITGSLSSLLDTESQLGPDIRRDLLKTAYEEADRLNRLVGNLLDMTRVQAGALKLAPQPCDLQDLIGVALQQFTVALRQRPVKVDIPADLPLVPLDFVLMTQVLTNLLDNAIKYAPPEAPLEVKVHRRDREIELQVADSGPGIAPTDLPHVFDKFYRSPQVGRIRGTGLGLAISKGIVEAHQGQIRLENRPGGGVVATITLPCEV
jgi:two-component system sensor histidine kinase KdpD